MAEIEERQAKIEGILEQMDRRLSRMEVEMEGLRTEIRNLHSKMDSNFRWQIGIIFTMWVTIILAVVVKG